MNRRDAGLPVGWSINPVYRGCTTVREWTACYRGESAGYNRTVAEARDYILTSDYAREHERRVNNRRDAEEA